MLYKNHISFNVWVRYFVWNFKGYLWNSTQNVSPIHWKMWILFTGENLRALRFKSSQVFLKRPPETVATWFIFVTEDVLISVWFQQKFQKKISIASSWKKMYEFQSRFHWSLFLRVQLTTRHNINKQLVIQSALNHYIDACILYFILRRSSSYTVQALWRHGISNPDQYYFRWWLIAWQHHTINTLRPRQNGHHFPTFSIASSWKKMYEFSIKISLKFVLKGPINKMSALVQIMAWRRPGDKPLSEQMMVSLLMHICVTQPQWVNWTNVWLMVSNILTNTSIHCLLKCFQYVNVYEHNIFLNDSNFFRAHGL